MQQNMVGQSDVATNQITQWFAEHGQEPKRAVYRTGSAILVTTSNWTQEDMNWLIAMLAVGPDAAIRLEMNDGEED